MKSISENYIFKEGQKLDDFDPNDISCFPLDRNQAEEQLFMIRAEFDDLQELLHAQGKHRILIVLQATDGAGKDNLIKNVFRGVNPKGVKVVNFKAPSEAELSKDYIYRIHQTVPSNGEIVIHNRSIYEDVLAVRVHNLVPKSVWSKRYRHINEFERMLTDEGTIILKFFLNISKSEQKRRLKDRLNDSTKGWKVTKADFTERKYWNDYQKAYNDIFKKTSTSYAPWYIIPANNKWYKNLIVASILLKTLKDLNIELPKINPDLKKMKLK